MSDIRTGSRVVYAGGPLGAYAEERIMPADRLVVLPEGISDQQAAAIMLKGLTVQYLIRQIHNVERGDILLFHAAAGGVGLIACQWAKSLGAIVIGTVGNEEKAKAAKAHGCDHPIIYTREDFVGRVDTITQGQKLPVVYDSVGKDTFMKSLDCLRPRALMVSFGQSSGPVGPVDLGIFAQKGSLFFTRPTLNTYAAKRADLLAMAEDLFEVVLSGAVKIEIGQTYPLPSSAAAAQRRPRGLPPTNKQEAAERREPAPAAVAPPPPSTSAEAAGERRYLTVMFCDLVGSTGIVAQLDAEEWRDLVGTYLDDASAAVRDVGRVLSDDVSASPMDRLGVVPR